MVNVDTLFHCLIKFNFALEMRLQNRFIMLFLSVEIVNWVTDLDNVGATMQAIKKQDILYFINVIKY